MPAHQQLAAVLWGLGIGIAMIAVVYITVSGGWFRKPITGEPVDADLLPEPIAPVHEYPEGIAEAHGPVPLIVRLVIIGFALWAIGYVALFVQRGYTFS